MFVILNFPSSAGFRLLLFFSHALYGGFLNCLPQSISVIILVLSLSTESSIVSTHESESPPTYTKISDSRTSVISFGVGSNCGFLLLV